MHIKLDFFVLILILLSVCCLNKSKEDTHIIKSGIGYDNFIIDETTLSDIINYYGNNYRIDSAHWLPPMFDSTQIFSISYSYDTIGVTFSFYPDSNRVFCITVKPPFQGKTKEGIILGISTFEDVVKAYGETEWHYIGNWLLDPIALIKQYDGIEFFQDYSGTIPIADSLQKEYLENKVTEIVIVKFHDK